MATRGSSPSAIGWQLNVDEKFHGRGTDFGYACSPLIEDGKVILPVGGKGASVVACPFQSGAECYRLEADDAETEDDATDDDETGHDRPPGVSLTSVWYSRKLSNDTASSVLVDGYIYGFDIRDPQAKAHRTSYGNFKCLELTTGTVLWETDRVGHASVIAADGKLILFNDVGEVLLARASPHGYEELARAEVFGGEICWTAPALHRGRLYLRSPTKAACLFVGKPEHLDRQRRQQARPTSEIVKLRRFDLAWVVGGERRYVFDPPDAAELARWYAFSLLGVLLPAMVLATAVYLPVRAKWPSAACGSGRVVFWTAAFLFGAAGTPVFNRFCDPFTFTWPVCLFVAHQVVLNAVVSSGRQARQSGKSRGVVLAATLFFIGVCLGYYLICRRFSLALEWTFLLGFLPSWPIAVPAAYRLRRQGPPWREFLWAGLSFSALFWAVGGILLWRVAMPG